MLKNTGLRNPTPRDDYWELTCTNWACSPNAVVPRAIRDLHDARIQPEDWPLGCLTLLCGLSQLTPEDPDAATEFMEDGLDEVRRYDAGFSSDEQRFYALQRAGDMARTRKEEGKDGRSELSGGGADRGAGRAARAARTGQDAGQGQRRPDGVKGKQRESTVETVEVSASSCGSGLTTPSSNRPVLASHSVQRSHQVSPTKDDKRSLLTVS